MLELQNIHKIYQRGTVNETTLFRGFSLTIPDKQFVCVVGSNGSGKTSMLNIICGSIPVDDGKILISGSDITAMPEHKRLRRIGRVYQDPARGTCPSMTILENMSMADNKGKPFNLLPCVNKKKTDFQNHRQKLCTILLWIKMIGMDTNDLLWTKMTAQL
ncbi:MAG: ATP-binding cassette domain-containing protein [Clostridia bacterium]|nr:ATP-binding cassette domain-containing protein [Clostridia bacterium]